MCFFFCNRDHSANSDKPLEGYEQGSRVVKEVQEWHWVIGRFGFDRDDKGGAEMYNEGSARSYAVPGGRAVATERKAAVDEELAEVVVVCVAIGIVQGVVS